MITKILEFIAEHNVLLLSILAGVYEIFIRVKRTDKNYSLIDNGFHVLKFIIENSKKFTDFIIPNRKKLLVVILALSCISSFAQTNGTFKGIISTNVTDTVAIQSTRSNLQGVNGNTGVIYYDKGRDKWRVWQDSAYFDLISDGGSGGLPNFGLRREIPFINSSATNFQYSDSLFYNPVLKTFNFGGMRMFSPDATVSSQYWGQNAGNTAGLDNGNIGIGRNVLQDISTGTHNIAIGAETQQNVTTGSSNISIGSRTLEDITTAQRNIAIGDVALANQLNNNNVAIGYRSMTTQTNGTGNTGVGNNTLELNVSGVENTALGFSALNRTTGNASTAIGYNVLNQATTGINTGVGWRVLQVTTTGDRNTAIGDSALGGITTGGQNIGVGTNTLLNNSTGSGNVALGYRAGENETGSNKLYIDNSNTATPLIGGDFSTNVLDIGGTQHFTVIPANDDAITRLIGLNGSNNVVYRNVSSLPGTNLTNTQIAYGSGANTITSESDFIYTASSNAIQIGVTTDGILRVGQGSGSNQIQIASVGQTLTAQNAANSFTVGGASTSSGTGGRLNLQGGNSASGGIGGVAGLAGGSCTGCTGGAVEINAGGGTTGGAITISSVVSGTDNTITINVGTSDLIFTINRTSCAGAPSGAVAKNGAGNLSVCP